jgi:hypothetical protein
MSMNCRESRARSDVGINWGRAMAAGDYLAAAVLIALILWGVKGVITLDKFKL